MRSDSGAGERMAFATDASRVKFRLLAIVTFVTTYALIVLGAVVRVTESGDACPDWPRCHGELIPPLEPAVLIEFSHRLLASLVGLLVLATAVLAWRWQRRVPLVRWGATLAVLLVGGQIILGGLTVLNDLPPSMVTAHLALASALLATLLVVVIASFELKPAGNAERRTRAASFRNLTIFAALAAFGVMLTGSYVSGAGAGLAFRDWPLFDGRLLPEGGRLAMIHVTHRLAAAAIGLLLLYVAVRAWRWQRWHQPMALGTALALLLYVAQVFVGAANIWTLLQPAAGAAHLALAVALWATLTGVVVFAQRAAQPISQYAETPRQQPSLPPPEVSPEPARTTVPAGGPS